MTATRLNLPLLRNVIDGGYCIGCGACASLEHSPVAMKFDERGRYRPYALAGREAMLDDPRLAAVCPFTGSGPNEDELAKSLFAGQAQLDDPIGYHRDLYAGVVAEGDFRQNGSSGGLGSWLLCEMLERGLVDAVIHVGSETTSGGDHQQAVRGIPAEAERNGAPLFQYRISRSASEIRAGAKSRYYPVEMSAVLAAVRARDVRYAVVGVPCFIKALRLLARADAVVDARILYYVGLVCGHLKSKRFADMLAWQAGIEPGKLLDIDFRKKLAGRDARDYGIAITGIQNQAVVKHVVPAKELYGYNWGWGLFKYQACDYCDDVFAETADITIGDAWLDQYAKDSEGTNIIVVRSAAAGELVNSARQAGRLRLEPLSVADMIRSQDAGLRHRREGLAYRLHMADRRGVWRPEKRTLPGAGHLTSTRRGILRLRIKMMEQSHTFFEDALVVGQFSEFKRKMAGVLRAYEALHVPVRRRALFRLKRLVKMAIQVVYPNAFPKRKP